VRTQIYSASTNLIPASTSRSDCADNRPTFSVSICLSNVMRCDPLITELVLRLSERSPPDLAATHYHLIFRQGACLGFNEIWIDGRVIGVLSIHGIEFFPDPQESLAIDVCGHRIGVELASGPADFSESLRLLKNRIRNGDCSFHCLSKTRLYPCCRHRYERHRYDPGAELRTLR
jgi:hypothetical protein